MWPSFAMQCLPLIYQSNHTGDPALFDHLRRVSHAARRERKRVWFFFFFDLFSHTATARMQDDVVKSFFFFINLLKVCLPAFKKGNVLFRT